MNQNVVDNRYMEFRLGDQLYAIPLLSIKEVIQKPEVTVVPNMPAHFEGMMNLRGQILGIFSVRKKLGAKARSTEGGNDVVVVIEQNSTNVGMIVDEVTRVLHPDPSTIRPAPLKEDDPAQVFVRSVIQSGDDLILTIDVAQLLDLEKYNSGKKAA